MTSPEQNYIRYLDIDSQGSIADRFGVNWDGVYSCSLQYGPYGGKRSDEFESFLRGAQYKKPPPPIWIPLQPDPWIWESRPAHEKTTLAAFCKKLIKTERAKLAGGPSITAAFLYFHIRNFTVRERLLDAVSKEDVDARRKADADPASMALEPDDYFMVPFPNRQRGSALSAAPNASTPVEADATWVVTLTKAHHRIIGDSKLPGTAKELERLNMRCDELADQWRAVAYRLGSLQHFLCLLEKHTSPSSPTDLAEARRVMTSLHEYVANLSVNPAPELEPKKDKDRWRVAGKLKKQLNSKKLKQAIILAIQHPSKLIGDKYACHYAAEIYVTGILALQRSPLSDKAIPKIEAALAYVGTATEQNGTMVPPPDADITLAKLLSLVNTPKKWYSQINSLARQCLYQHSLWQLTKAAKAPQQAGEMAEQLLKKYLKTFADLSEEEKDEIRHAIRYTEKREEVAKLASKNGDLTATKFWKAGTSILGIISLVCLYEADEKDRVKRYCDLTSSTISTAMGTLQTLTEFSEAGKFGLQLAKVAPGFNIVTSLIGLFSSTITALTTSDAQQRVETMVQMLGSTGGLAGLMLACPALDLAGLAILAGLEIYKARKDSGLATKRLFMAQIDDLNARTKKALFPYDGIVGVREMIKLHVEGVIKAATDGAFATFPYNAAVAEELKAIGFEPYLDDIMGYPPAPHKSVEDNYPARWK